MHTSSWLRGVAGAVVPGGGTPAHEDLTAAYTAAPPAAGDPVAFTVEGPNTQHVVYRGTDQHIYEVRW